MGAPTERRPYNLPLGRESKRLIKEAKEGKKLTVSPVLNVLHLGVSKATDVEPALDHLERSVVCIYDYRSLL